MTLFDTNGHLTDAALAALAEGALCEAQRLDVAQHLAQCDECLLRFTALDGEQMPQLSPSRDLVAPALHRAQRGRRVEFWQRCGIAAAAACFMLVAWRAELFSGLGSINEIDDPSADLRQSTALFAQTLNGWNERLTQTLYDTLTYTPDEKTDDHQQRSDQP